MSQSVVDAGIALEKVETPGWRYTPHLLIFTSSACIMIIELVAGRLIARHLGVSLYTWTSVIGVVLAGMSVGNYVGGRMADRWKAQALLGWLFMAASAMCLVTLVLNNAIADHSPLESLSWPLRTFCSVLIIFLIPALALGTISPVSAKLALSRSLTVGSTIGSVYACGAVGSILGTLATGFYLIAWLGSKGVVLSVCLILSLVGLVLGPRRWIHVIWVFLLFALLIASRISNEKLTRYSSKLGLSDPTHDLFAADSNYQYVWVSETEKDDDEQGRLLVLSLDCLDHGYVDTADPAYLHYEYEGIYADIADRFLKEDDKPATFFIGGGSYTFQRWVLNEWPGAIVDVAEIDPMVLEANYKALGLPRDTAIRTVLMDARNAVDDLPAEQRYDLIIGDGFNDLAVPWHLLTLEFSQKIKNHLAPTGAYMVNIVDAYSSGQLLGAYYLTLKCLFKNVYVFCTDENGVGDERDTFVLVASETSIDVSDWQPAQDNDLTGSVLTESNLAEIVRKCGRRILTDDNAPVENLLEPVLRQRQ